MKKNNGITIIALIITIIILLIISGITIAAMTKKGLFENADKAKEEYLIEQAREQLEIKKSEIQVEKKGEATLEDFVECLKEDDKYEYKVSLTKTASLIGNVPNLNNVEEIYVTCENIEFKVDKELNIEYSGIKYANGSEKDDSENIQLKECSRYIAVTATGVQGDLLLKVNIPETDDEIIKSINYYINDKLVHSGKEKEYEATGLKVNEQYEVYAIVEYDNKKISTTAVSKDIGVTIENGLVGYWPLQGNINSKIPNETIGELTVSSQGSQPDFSEGAYKMNNDFYLTSQNTKIISSPKTMACQFKLKSISSKSYKFDWGESTNNIIFGSTSRESTLNYGITLKPSGSHITYNGRYGYGDAINYKGNYIGEWINAVFTQDASGNSKLYFNGTLVSTGTQGKDESIKLILGGNADGLLKNFAIYNRVLSQEEAGKLFAK